jgi:hypothetical protein
MTKLSRPAGWGVWALSLAFLCLGAAPLARADGSVDTSTAQCESVCYSYNNDYGPISAASGIAALCTISGSVASVGQAYGYWTIEYYTVWSQSVATSANVSTEATAYGIYYAMTDSTSGSADCSGNSSGFTQDADGYDYGSATTNSSYFN